MSADPDKKFKENNPIHPHDEFIVMFDEKIPFLQVQDTLEQVFNKHSKGELLMALPGGTTLLISDVNWDIVEDLKQSPGVRSIGPNRKARLC